MLRLGTRGSLLARTQSGLVARELERLHPGLKVELITVTTSGDTILDRPLHEFGGKGLFTKELENALLKHEVDCAVHSFKDVPTTMPLVEQANLIIAAVPVREDPRDVLVSRERNSIWTLAHDARVGTGSLRRGAQLLALRPDITVLPIRGNIDTRLRKLRQGEFDAIIVAMAGVRRCALYDESIMTPIDTQHCLPAAAQGALAIQCRRDDGRTRDLLSVMNDLSTERCVQAERQIVQALGGDCYSPIAALATLHGDQMHVRAAVAGRGGEPPVIQAQGATLREVLDELREQGAYELLGTTEPEMGKTTHA